MQLYLMENPSQKEESKGEEMLLYNNIYQSSHQVRIVCLKVKEVIDENDSDSKSCGENEESLQTGRWNADEHNRFIKGCLLYGNNWKKVKKYVQTRSSAQIRSHAQKYLIKLSKKYPQGDLNRSKGGLSYDLKSIENIINKHHLNNEETEYAEKMILSKFKNSLNDKSFPNLVFDDFNFKSESSSIKKESKKKDQIFVCIKIPKNKKLEEMQKMLSNNQYSNNINGNNNNNNNSTGNYMNGYYNLNLTLKDQHLLQQENFIHSCLDSHDPNDLTKMIGYFNNINDTSAIVSSINDTIKQSNDKLFNVNCYGGIGYDLNNNQQYYSNVQNIKDNFDIDFKAYGFNAVQQETIPANNSIEEKEATPQPVNQEEQGQYYIGLLNDNIKPKANNTPASATTANTTNHNNTFIIDQNQINPNQLQPAGQYYFNIQTLQRNPLRPANGQQSAFSNLNQNQNTYRDDIFKQFLTQHSNQNPQFFQQFIP